MSDNGTTNYLLPMIIPAFLGLSYSGLCSISSVKNWHYILLSLFLGITGSIFYFAHLLNPLAALFKATSSYIVRTITGFRADASDTSSMYFAIQQLNSQLQMLFSHLYQWGEQLYSGHVVQDKLIISMIWGLAFWLASIWAGWIIFRYHSALIAVLPAGAMLVATMNYERGNPLWLIPLIGITHILISITSYKKRERYWVTHNIDYAEDIRVDLSVVTLFLAIGFMATSAFIPSFSIQKLLDATQRFSQSYQGKIDTLAMSLGLRQHSQSTDAFNFITRPNLPRSHLIGSGPELSKEVVMVVETGDLPPAPSLESLPSAPHIYYWRNTTYDIYTGHGWTTSPIHVVNYKSDAPIFDASIPITGTLQLVHQSFQLTRDLGGSIYSTGQLLSINQGYQVAWRASPNNYADDNSQHPDADQFAAMFEGSTYNADSYINTASLKQLRSATGRIPSWIQDRYLALPEGLPDRVRQLAIDLTKDQHSSYDQATAIEAYLRTYPYTLDLPPPPVDRDIVDYFLFVLKRGYCDYYASAMVVMARSIGLPARLVTGYVSGSYDPVNARYIVTQANAHSWAEVYLPGAGWVEFEPTSGVSTITRLTLPADNYEISPGGNGMRIYPRQWLNIINHNWLMILEGMLGTILMGTLFWVARDQWQLRHSSPSTTIARLYKRMYYKARPLVVKTLPGDTPNEYANRLAQRLKSSDVPNRWRFYLQPGIDEAASLTNLYIHVVYSPHIPAQEDQKKAIDIWSRLSIRLWLATKITVCLHWISLIKPIR